MKNTNRPDWDVVWLNIAKIISHRSPDENLKVGCVIVTSDNAVVLANGYNGSYAGGPNVRESPEPGKSGFIHAEVNALIKCAYHTRKRKIMYLTHSPCYECAKLIINAKISKVVYLQHYRDIRGVELLNNVGIETIQKELFQDDLLTI